MSGITLDDVILDAGTSNIAISDGTDTLAINGDGSLNATVTATDLDIRDLINTQDSVAVGDETNIVDMAIMDSAFSATSVAFPIMGIRQDGSGSPVSATGDAHPLVFNNDGELKVAADLTSSVADDDADSGNPIKVGGRGVSGLLSALSATGDRFDLLGDLYRRTWVNNSYNIDLKISREIVGATAAEIVSTPMAGRTSITIQNASNDSVWLGHDGTVTADDSATGGLEIKKNSSYTDSFGENIDIFLISDGAGRNVKVLEKG
jgi:hypothetical protein